MNRYKFVDKLGQGSFGVVMKAIDKTTGEVVAIKSIKSPANWKEGMSLKEIRTMMYLNHPNIVPIKEVISKDGRIYIVMEQMSFSLCNCIERCKHLLSEDQVRNILFQILQGVAYLHSHNIFHRDIKPENILLKGDVVKIADFGLAREMDSRPPYTDYIATRWYRAPEILLRSDHYNNAVDLWAVGCIMAEVIMCNPLFPGNSEEEQLYKICSVIGTPTEEMWEEGILLANRLHFQFPQFKPLNLKSYLPCASQKAVDLISALLSWNPLSRPSAVEALQFPFFVDAYSPF